MSILRTALLSLAVTFAFTQSANANPKKLSPEQVSFTKFCSAYLAGTEFIAQYHGSFGKLSKALKRAASQAAPVAYSMQSLGFNIDANQPVNVLGARMVHQFSASGATTQTQLPIEKLTSDIGGIPSLLVVEKGKDLEWQLSHSPQYDVAGYTINPEAVEIEKIFLRSGQVVGTNAGFDHVLMPEVWQTLSSEHKKEMVRQAYKVLRPGGTLRISVSIHDVESVDNTLSNLMSDQGGIQSVWDSFNAQIKAALPNEAPKMLVRVQKVSFNPSEELAVSPEFWASFGPRAENANYNVLGQLTRPALQTLVVVRKPGSGWGEWLTGY